MAIGGLMIAAALVVSAERRAVDYLAIEVPRWGAENRCHSCHNNGDGARALFRTTRVGIRLDPKALAETSGWLARPSGWDAEGERSPTKDRTLALIQFASALESDPTSSPAARRDAAGRVAAEQGGDGSWRVEDGGAVGSPAAYGRTLATAMAVRTLIGLDREGQGRAIERGTGWLRDRPIGSVVDAAAFLIADPGRRGPIAYLLAAEGGGGGWGPHPGATTEPFDTALAILALTPDRDRDPAIRRAIGRGRAALIRLQRGDGSWPATTRPSGGESYAEEISTSAWATLALLASRP